MSLQQQALEDAFKNATPPKIVRSVGDLNSVLADGKLFHRRDKIDIPSMGNILCAPYDNQFIFRDIRKMGWTLFCSCGSPAVVVGYDAYKRDASKNSGELIVCYTHSRNNKHADGSS